MEIKYKFTNGVPFTFWNERQKHHKHFRLTRSTGCAKAWPFLYPEKSMKLSPEAKQAIKTAIEQLRFLLVDDAMDTVREEVGKRWMDNGKGDDGKITISGDCRVEGKLSAGKIDGDVERPERLKKTFIQLTKAAINELDDKPVSEVVLEAPELEISGSNPFEEIQAEIKQLKAQVEQLARQTSCVESELTQQKAISERLSINLLSYGAYRE